VQRAFKEVRVDFDSDRKREAIVDSWPADLDCSAAEEDWGWEPDYDLRRAFDEYLVPNIRQRYATDQV
jgi:nucleoside-diphosphate-sugar epimerase